jgi:hypothetical protein
MVCGTGESAVPEHGGAHKHQGSRQSLRRPLWSGLTTGDARAVARGGSHQGVTPERLRPTTPARTKPIDTSFRVDTVSPRKAMPITAVPAAPIPVHTA